MLGVSDKEWLNIQENLGQFIKVGEPVDYRELRKSLHPIRTRSLVKKALEKEGAKNERKHKAKKQE